MNHTQRIEVIESKLECQDKGHIWFINRDRTTKVLALSMSGLHHYDIVCDFTCSRCGKSKRPSRNLYQKYQSLMHKIERELK